MVTESVVAGRVSRSRMAKDGKQCIIWNVHNYKLPADARRETNRRIEEDRLAAQRDPNNVSLWVGGDFNFPPPLSQEFSLRAPSSATRSHSRRQADEAAKWPALVSLTELDGRGPTHVSKASVELSVLDRLFTALPAWCFTQLDGQVHIRGDPVVLDNQGISDHAPVLAKLFFTVRKYGRPPVPKHILEHAKFPAKLQELERQTCIDELPVFERLSTHKECIRRAAAELVKDLLVPGGLVDADAGASKEVRRIAIAHIAKVVWKNDQVRAKALLRQCPLAREHVGVDVASLPVRLRDPERFAAEFDSLRAELAVAQGARDGEREADDPSRRLRGSGTGTSFLARLWSPFSKVATLGSILNDAGERASDASEMTAALREHWKPTFTRVHEAFDDREAKAFLDRWSPDWSGERIPSPSLVDFMELLRRFKHSAPGPDGIPYAGWKAAGKKGAETLLAVSRALQAGQLPPRGFNAQLAIFVPKDVAAPDPDPTSLDRQPADTRPLSLKNSDAKLVTSVTNRKVRKVLAKRACSVQRGFVPGRQLLNNVIDMDAAGRAYGIPAKSVAPGLPCIALFDFAAAFPSIAHVWIWAAIGALGLPGGLVDLLKAVYHANVAYTRDGQDLIELYEILSGILQGCPGSGTIFTWCLDPFLFCILDGLGKDGLVRACAGDVSVAVKSLRTSAKVEGTYRLIQRLTLLQVKPKKCVIIPTRDVVTPELRENIREWLRRWIPAWSEFAIEGRGKLLGVVIGPSAGGFQWLAAEAKYERRTLDIASTRAPPSVALRLHATRAVPTLGYLAQVLEPPPQAISSQLARFHALCHIPNNSFSLTAAYKMAEAGGPKFTTLRPFACAAAARAALTTLDTWEYWCRELRKISAEDGAIAREVVGLHWPSCWNTMPLAFRLEMAVSPCILRAQGEPAIGRGVEAFCTEHRIFGLMRRQRAKKVPSLQAKLQAIGR